MFPSLQVESQPDPVITVTDERFTTALRLPAVRQAVRAPDLGRATREDVAQGHGRAREHGLQGLTGQ